MSYNLKITSEQWHEMYDRIPNDFYGCFDQFYGCETDEVKCMNTDGTDHYFRFDTEQEAIIWSLKCL